MGRWLRLRIFAREATVGFRSAILGRAAVVVVFDADVDEEEEDDATTPLADGLLRARFANRPLVILLLPLRWGDDTLDANAGFSDDDDDKDDRAAFAEDDVRNDAVAWERPRSAPIAATEPRSALAVAQCSLFSIPPAIAAAPVAALPIAVADAPPVSEATTEALSRGEGDRCFRLRD